MISRCKQYGEQCPLDGNSSGGSKKIDGLGLLSFRKPTKQSSLDHGGIPSRAVDGNINGNWGGKSVTHTRHGKGQDNWWQVDLQGKTCIG